MSWQIATSGLPVRSVSFVLVFIIVVGVGPEPASALDPSSPQVRSMIGRAKTYLESRQAEESRLGGRCLVGAVFMKDGQKNHPLVMEAVEACREASRATDVSYDVYSLGISIMFLVDLDSEEYRSEIQRLLDRLMRIQKDFGGWGYTSGPSVLTGDTSMTQYAVLALWTSHQRGYVRSSEPVQRVAAWLLRTQDPSGAWGYQGRDPGEYTRIEQSEVRHSLAAAGLGSTYMCADMLGMAKSMVGRRGRSSPENSDAELPPALKLVVEESGTKKLAGGRVDPSVLSRAIRDGNTWFEKNFTIKTEEWNYYYLYGLERYKSFRELVEGQEDPDPAWYNAGVEFLASRQAQHGGWEDAQGGNAVSTAFAALFLLRSTKKTISEAGRDYGPGTLAGGRGLPTDLTNVRIRGGKIVPKALGLSAKEVLDVLEDADAEELDKLADNPGHIVLSNDPDDRQKEIQRLGRLVQGGDYQSRRMAVQALARQRDFDLVPLFIYAIGDGDPRVCREAIAALRFVSRKFDGRGLSDDPTFEEKLAVKEDWKQWYLSVRPDAEFLD